MKVSKNIICKKVLENDVLIDISNNSKHILKLNETSSYIFKLIQKETALEDIINYVVSEYNVDLLTASKDVTDFINELERLKVIKQ